LQFGKASDCDAITWGTGIGGRTATAPKKVAGCQISRQMRGEQPERPP